MGFNPIGPFRAPTQLRLPELPFSAGSGLRPSAPGRDQGRIAQGGQPTAKARADQNGIQSRHGQFHLQSYLGFKGAERGLQVKLGYTDTGFTAIQTSTATYVVPAGVHGREEIRQWVQQAHRSGAISGAYPLSPGARQQPAAAPPRTSQPPDGWGLALPDAIAYNLSAANQAHRRDFVLVNPTTGSLTHFVSHKLDVVQFGSLRLNRVETVHYSFAGKPVVREDGLTWSNKLAGGATLFLNFRGGDSNLRSPNTALSGSIGFFGPPSALGPMVKALKAAGASAAAAGLDRILRAAGTGGSEFGLAWRASVELDQRSGEVMVNLSGHRIPLHRFIDSLGSPGARNEGLPKVASLINRDAYLAGANPYALADGTRGADGRYRNHGDPVSAIAGGILKLAEQVQPGAAPVRTNAAARQVLERALLREAAWIDPGRSRPLGMLPAPARLSPESRQTLSGVLKLLERYDMDFGSPTIRRAAQSGPFWGARPTDMQFVRAVFQGNFRVDSLSPANPVIDALVFGFNRHLGLAATVLSPRTVAPDDVMLMQSRVRLETLKARLDAFHGGVLGALDVSTRGLPEAQRGRMESNALSLLDAALTRRILRQGGTPDMQALYGAFLGLRQDERAMLGAQVHGNALGAVEIARIVSRLAL